MEKLKTLGLSCLVIIIFFLITTLVLEGDPFYYFPVYLGMAMIYALATLLKESPRKGLVFMTMVVSVCISLVILAIWEILRFILPGIIEPDYDYYYLISQLVCVIMALLQTRINLMGFIPAKLLNKLEVVSSILLISTANGIIAAFFSESLSDSLNYGLFIVADSGFIGLVIAIPILYIWPLMIKAGKRFLTPA